MVKKDAMAYFWRITAPHPIALITTVSKDGKSNVITVAWIIPTSIKPPLLAVSIGNTRYSHKLIAETGEFVANIPSKELLSSVEYCGSTSGRTVNKFEKTGLTPKPAKKVEPPIIEECVAHIECKVVDRLPTGDHTIFVGKVQAASADAELFTEMWQVERAKLLQHVGGATYTTPSSPFGSNA